MKLLALAAALAALITFARADVEIPREEAATLKSMDLEDIEKKAHELEGKIVRLKFNYRGTSAAKSADGGLKGSLHIYVSSLATNRAVSKFGSIEVTVPPEGAAWFTKIPTNESRATILVIARLVKGRYSGLAAELLGREIKTDLKGSRIIW